jgi:hypothetical protein
MNAWTTWGLWSSFEHENTVTTPDFTLARLHLRAVKRGYTVPVAPIFRTDDPSSQYRRS